MRKALYVIGGVLLSSILFVFILIGMPEEEIVKSSANDFQIKDEEISLNEPVEKDETGSIFRNGSYQLSMSEVDSYENEGVVSYKKYNPMFFFDKKKFEDDKKSEEEAKKEEAESNEASTGESTGSPTASVSYGNCAELNKVYPDGLKSDEEGYSKSLDRDNDGIACQSTAQGGLEIKEDDKNFSVVDGKSFYKGFNVQTRKYEKVEITESLSSFSKDGILPLDYEYMSKTSGFGERKDPLSNEDTIHSGIDFSAKDIDEANVYSVSSGEIISVVESDKGYGNHIIINHNGYKTLYGHMSTMSDLKVGDKIKTGETLGKVGSTGRSTGSHLHFEVRIGDVTVNPVLFINEIGKVD